MSILGSAPPTLFNRGVLKRGSELQSISASIEAVSRKILQQVNRDCAGIVPCPKSFGKKLYARQNRGTRLRPRNRWSKSLRSYGRSPVPFNVIGVLRVFSFLIMNESVFQ